MLLKKFRSKKGAVFVFVTIMLALLFPLIMFSIIDTNNINRVSKELKISLNAAAKSAASRIDWNQVPNGDFKIDPVLAQSAFVDIMQSNMQVTTSKIDNYYEYINPQTGGSLRFYFEIFNDRHEGINTGFPSAGNVPVQVYARPIQISVDRPTVFAVATVEYKTSRPLGNRVVKITQFASSQLNFIPANKQPSATYP